ncbi:IclR family transcriptional regulator [Gulosibacter molinativorax]|uniref:IclR family transcriptional regulator n=1 Tax=Gulosibacter molinativorax TaxID=256821 RepID=A0ABT7CBT7_9MICO|nr:IclR family transcriptional regulator [Gulosibacter molinativorax]MDJ1372625.1 IclR family transcriptional regulator [Gulosibacter molinativorax]QUY62591.1 IclR family transcriptional regulator [Gulosibacter molinativorax]
MSSNSRHNRNSTSDRTLQILGLFNDQRIRLTPAQIMRELDISRSTAYRYIQSLVNEQFLESAPDGSLRLGMRVLELARLARAGYGLSELAVPVMRQLAAAHKQTVLLTVLMGRSVVCLEREESPDQFVRLSYEPGVELPLNAGASALVLLAWKPRAELRALLGNSMRRFTENTITDIDELLERLDTIRAAGEVVTLAEVDRDALGIAVPLMAGDGEVVGGLSIVALQSRFSEEQQSRALEDLHGAADRISSRLRLANPR